MKIKFIIKLHCMTVLEKFLTERLKQLKQRAELIPRYIAMEGQTLGKKTFTLNDLPLIQNDIEETKAAIAGIKRCRVNSPQMVKPGHSK